MSRCYRTVGEFFTADGGDIWWIFLERTKTDPKKIKKSLAACLCCVGKKEAGGNTVLIPCWRENQVQKLLMIFVLIVYVNFSLFAHATLGGAKMEGFHHEPLIVNILALH